MNKDRTLEVSNIYELFAGVDNKTVKFKCKALGDDNVVKDGVDFGQGTEHPLILILPEVNKRNCALYYYTYLHYYIYLHYYTYLRYYSYLRY